MSGKFSVPVATFCAPLSRRFLGKLEVGLVGDPERVTGGNFSKAGGRGRELLKLSSRLSISLCLFLPEGSALNHTENEIYLGYLTHIPTFPPS